MNDVKYVSSTIGLDKDYNPLSAEELIAYTARVSNPSNQTNKDTAPKLLKYLLKHKHWSPFEMASLTLEVTTSRAIASQILRHRSFVFQEFSQRYSEAQNVVRYSARRQDTKNKQNSIDDMNGEDREWFADAQEIVKNQSLRLYKDALKRGIAKEQARFLLPLGTETTLYMCGTVRSWITYFLVRLDKSTQKEHRDIALQAWYVFEKEFPSCSEALKEEYPEIFVKGDDNE